MKKVVKLTPELMKRLVREEIEKLQAERAKQLSEAPDELESVESKKNDAEEVEADEYADTLERKVDWYKANKIKETKLIKQLKALREQNARLKKEIASKL